MPDWTTLAPHRPLNADDTRYVPPPREAGNEIAERLIAGTQIVLVGGPTGIGKSTELGRAAAYLRGTGRRVPCLVPIDMWENMRRLTPEQLLLRVAGRVAYIATQNLGLPLNPDLLAPLVKAGVLTPSVLRDASSNTFHASATALARAVLDDVARLSSQGRVTLLIDGIEKVPEGTAAAELFEALTGLPDHVEQVVVVPWHVTYGPLSETVIRSGEHWLFLHPKRAEGEGEVPVRAFLREILARRLGLDAAWLDPARTTAATGVPKAPPVEFAAVVEQAITLSGGIPRTFLQIMVDAGTTGRLRHGEAWPHENDLADAIAELEDGFRRALLPGDTRASFLAEGTDGRELELDRKVRLLSRGVLLERRDGKRAVMEIHPLARRPLGEGGR